MVDDADDEPRSRFACADLADIPLRELLLWRGLIDTEMKARGHVRTASSMAGELMERVVADAYEGELAEPGAKSADVLLSGGRRVVQVKARSLPGDAMRHWAFRDLDFDLAVVVRLHRETSEIDWARELSQAEVSLLARPHDRDGMRVRMAAALAAGKDVTVKLRKAYATLR